jgi:hypothetical protein
MTVVMLAKAPGSSELLRKNSKIDGNKNRWIESGKFFENDVWRKAQRAREEHQTFLDLRELEHIQPLLQAAGRGS